MDEKGVEVVHTFNPSSHGIENYCYPKAGTKNASSALKLLEFSFSESGEVSESERRATNLMHLVDKSHYMCVCVCVCVRELDINCC